jgi:predicted ester cyclase
MALIEMVTELVHQWVEEIWNQGQFQRLGQFHPPIFTNHGQPSSLEEVERWHLQNRATFPDVHYIIDNIFSAGNQIAFRWTATATHQGTLWGMIPATGKTITWNGMHMLRVVDQQIVEVWAIANTVAQLQQMGVTLQPPARPE